jgi:quinol monooxygenase YgiN
LISFLFILTQEDGVSVGPVLSRPCLKEATAEATESSVGQAPGFVSASLHRSIDGTKVTMYAQWRSTDDYQAMRWDPLALPFFQEALTIARFEPGVYEVVRTFAPSEPN